MSTNTKIFQIYFKPELLAHCDPDFEPMDNTDNPRPELREWDKWDREHENILAQNLDYWGFVSWKFKEKMGLTGRQVLDWINTNPGYDVYLLNPCIVNEAVFENSWVQGDLYHPNLSRIGEKFLLKYGFADLRKEGVIMPFVEELFTDRNSMIFANYVVGNKKFWTEFMEFSRRIFVEAEKDPVFNDEVFGLGASNYAHDKSLPMFTFLIERLIPTFIVLKNFKALGYRHTIGSVLPKYKHISDQILILSDLKTKAIEHKDVDIFTIWVFYKNKFLRENPGVLNLE